MVNTCASEWTRNDKLKLKLVRPEKKQKVYDAQTCKNANPERELNLVHWQALHYSVSSSVISPFFWGGVARGEGEAVI